ncbi:MAG: hypothetical protein QXF82_06700 [Nitrososphaeria archaeon]|jgi:hypothetical protein
MKFNIIDLLSWVWDNLTIVLLFVGFVAFFGVVLALTRGVRTIKDGIKEMMTPLGAFITIVFIIMVFVAYIMIRTSITPLN